MNRIRQWSCLAVFVSTVAFALPALADDIKVESAIKSAIVYSDRATVTRTATVQIPAGAHNLVFSSLPMKMFTNSLRIGGTAQASVTFGALSHKTETSEDFVVAGVQALADRKQEVVNAINLYQVERSALAEANSFITNWAKQANAKDDGDDATPLDLNPEKWIAASDGLSAKMLANMKAQLALDLKIAEENKKLEKIDADLNQFLSDQKQSYTVTVPFESDKAASLNVELSYQIADVGWQPTYDARLDVEAKKLELVQYGSVWQRTGEEWNGIALSLSTAQPSRGASLPQLNPIWLSILAPRPPMAPGVMSSSAMPAPIEAAGDRLQNSEEQTITHDPQQRWRRMQEERVLRNADAGEGAAEDPFGFENEEIDMEQEDPLETWRRMQEERVQRAGSAPVAVQMNTSGFIGEYKVTGPATVKPDGTQAKLQIAQLENDAALFVKILPQVSTDGFMVAKFTLKGDAPILPGTLSLFRDGAFIGQDRVAAIIRPGEEGEMSFGVDDAVKVKREMLKDEAAQTGLIAMSKIIERNFVTEIESYHKQDIQIEVMEMVPASKDETILVEILKDKTTQGYEADYKNVKGATRWTSVLKPQQKAAVNLGWKVSWPKDKNLSGL